MSSETVFGGLVPDEANTHRLGGHLSVVLAVLLGTALLLAGLGVGPVLAQDEDSQERGDPVAEFTAVGVDGEVAINAQNMSDPIPLTPESVDEPIIIEGILYEDGSWESTNVSFTNLSADEIDGLPVDIDLEPGSAFEGEIDRDGGRMTANGVLEVIVPTAGEKIDVATELTTGQSNALNGSVDGLDTDFATAKLVDNELTLPDATGDPIIDGVVGLPSPEPGRNWINLSMEISFREPQLAETGTIEGVVSAQTGGPVSGATVTAGDAQTTTGPDGSYTLEAETGTQTLEVRADGYSGENREITVAVDETRTEDFELTADNSRFNAVTVFVDHANPGETVTAEGWFQNLGNESGTREVSLSVGGASVTEEYELAAGEIAILSLEWETDEATAGVFDATLDTGDSTASRSVTVGGPQYTLGVDAPDIEPGETVTAVGTVTNRGVAPGTTEATVSIGDQTVTETVSLDPGQQTEISVDWETTAEDQGEHQASIETPDDRITRTFLVGDPVLSSEDADFLAESKGGYITFGWENYEDARGEGLAFPDRAEKEPIRIMGSINEEEGTWESVDTYFPELADPTVQFGGEVRAPGGLSGEIDREEGHLTVTGEFHVFVEGREDTSFVFNVTMRASPTGDIPSDVPHFTMHDNGTATTRLVSNDYAVNDRTNDNIIDAELKLPSPDRSSNYLELPFLVDFEPEDTELQEQGNVTADDGGGSGQVDSRPVTIGKGLGLAALGGIVLLSGATGARVVAALREKQSE